MSFNQDHGTIAIEKFFSDLFKVSKVGHCILALNIGYMQLIRVAELLSNPSRRVCMFAPASRGQFLAVIYKERSGASLVHS
jgi:hypothetical protein